ncbi:MAG TPA: hypothetical protein PKZ52_16970 [Cellvibrionaceae bacterium]|nr:hypothetical protein [Cellvibrionaceae bacterium]
MNTPAAPVDTALNPVPDATITHIASHYFGIETLATRNRDALDFHHIAVWNLKAALEAAYRAGHVSATGVNGGSGD